MVSKRKFKIEDLESWFSESRMSRFSGSEKSIQLYIWNTRIAKGLLEDIQHLEVLLRNRIDFAMSTEMHEPDWLVNISYYDQEYLTSRRLARGCDYNYTKNVNKAIKRSGQNSYSSDIKGRVIAELSFDHWRFFFVSSKEPTAWIYIKRHLPNYNLGGKPRQDFEDLVQYILNLRNRLSHHEPITRNKLIDEHTYLQEATQKTESTG